MNYFCLNLIHAIIYVYIRCIHAIIKIYTFKKKLELIQILIKNYFWIFKIKNMHYEKFEIYKYQKRNSINQVENKQTNKNDMHIFL